MKRVTFEPIISPRQGAAGRVVCFTATAQAVAEIARVDRIGRNEKGRLRGFQRPRIASHVREIRDYLRLPGAILPNAIVLAFGQEARLSATKLTVDVTDGPPGWVVDGQQRLTAALDLPPSRFELVVSAFICDSVDELKAQFIRINSTRPLPKPLIYELLPGTVGLPHRLADRTEAAVLTEALNYRRDSVLRGMIQQQTNPDGVIKDTVLQKMLINSMQHGALRPTGSPSALLEVRFGLVNAFYAAVIATFPDDWVGHDAKTSRLLHGVGVTAMGYVMDEIYGKFQARTTKRFRRGLSALEGKTHWTSGEWKIGPERRTWNSLQNINADYRLLTEHLVRMIRRAS